MSVERCKNCGNPKADHSKFDTFCLKLNNWLNEEFEIVEIPNSVDAKRSVQDEEAKCEAFEELVAP
jgi:hypothetical protein